MKSEIIDKITTGIEGILEDKGNTNIDTSERIASVLAGTFLLYKGIKNLGKHPILGFNGAAAGGLLLYRGVTGTCPVYEKLGIDTTDPKAINITEEIVVNAPRELVYAFWRNLSNLPKFMAHLREVEEIDSRVSLWKANAPGGLVDLKWNAEITREDQGTYLGWQSVAGSMIDNAGKIEFKDALSGTGTDLHIEIDYFPPAGSVGRGLASLFNGLFEKMIREDIQSFKKYAEAEEFKSYAGLTTL